MATPKTTNQQTRTIHLPLEKLEPCFVCNKTTTHRLCASCGEQSYCSEECQTKDWKNHKQRCGKTDRIPLEIFYPFLANLVDAAHVHPELPRHEALQRQIINDPHPEMGPCKFFDGSSAKLLLLGNKMPQEQVPWHPWWPTAETQEIRNRLYLRILREGWLLPNHMAVCISLLAMMYSTTWTSASESSDGKAQRRVRLKYRTSPIADFGIAKGEFSLVTQDLLAYYNMEDYEETLKNVKHGQDHKNHYWFYFKTYRGEELFLDCGVYTWNMGITVNNQPYLPDGLPSVGSGYAPAWFIDRETMRNQAHIHTVKKRFSILRNAGLHEAVKDAPRFSEASRRIIWKMMDEIAGEKCPAIEKEFAIKWAVQNCRAFATAINDRQWPSWPKEIIFRIDEDPGESATPTANEEKGFKEVIRLNRKFNRGEITKDELKDSVQAWRDKMAKKG